MNRTLVEMARSMLYYQHLEKHWWGEALHTAAYLTNRLPNSVRRELTPHEMFYNVRPRLDHLRVFGARGFVFVDQSKRKKWDAKAHHCIFLGYADGTKGYRVWDAEDEKLVVTRTISLNERSPESFVTKQGEQDVGKHQQVVILDDTYPPAVVPNLSAINEPMEVDSEGEPMVIDSSLPSVSPPSESSVALAPQHARSYHLGGTYSGLSKCLCFLQWCQAIALSNLLSFPELLGLAML